MADFGITEGLAVAGIAASVAGAGIGVMGAMQQANATSASAKYNAEVAANNKIAADNAATAAEQEGNIQQEQKARQEQLLIGQEKAGLAANGVDVGSGTAVDMFGDTKAAGMLDQLTIQNNATREANGFRNQGINYTNQANIDAAASQAALTGGELKAASTVVSSAGQVASQWYRYSSTTAHVDNTTGF